MRRLRQAEIASAKKIDREVPVRAEEPAVV
jgi:hypothetical protein